MAWIVAGCLFLAAVVTAYLRGRRAEGVARDAGIARAAAAGLKAQADAIRQEARMGHDEAVQDAIEKAAKARQEAGDAR